MNRISALLKETPLFLLPCEDIVADGQLGSRLSPATKSVSTLVLDFIDFRTMRNKVLWFLRHPVYGILL